MLCFAKTFVKFKLSLVADNTFIYQSLFDIDFTRIGNSAIIIQLDGSFSVYSNSRKVQSGTFFENHSERVALFPLFNSSQLVAMNLTSFERFAVVGKVSTNFSSSVIFGILSESLRESGPKTRTLTIISLASTVQKASILKKIYLSVQHLVSHHG